MKNKAKLILASAVFVAALMLLVPLAQIDMSGGGGTGNSNSDSIVLSDGTPVTEVSDLNGLKSALDAAKNSGNKDIKLTKAISITELSAPLTIPDGVTLDLNGFTLSIPTIGHDNSNRIAIENDANVIIKNGKITYSGADGSKSPIVVGKSKTAASSAQTQTLTLTDVNISSNGYGVAIFAKGNLTVNDGSITAVNSAISTNGGNPATVDTTNSCDAVINLNGGQYVSTSTAAIFFPGGKTLTVNDNSSSNSIFFGKTGFDIRSGNVTINNATIYVTGDSNEKKTDNTGPTPWGMGIAIFDSGAYGKNTDEDSQITQTPISVTYNNTSIVNAQYDYSIIGFTNYGDIKKDDGSLNTTLPTFTASHKILLTNSGSIIINIEKNNTDNSATLSTTNTPTKHPITIETINGNNFIFANKETITISESSDSKNSKIIYNGKTFVDNFDLSTFTVFGGYNNNDTEITTSITMSGGKVYGIAGGGYGAANVTTSNVTINGGTATYVTGGGWSTDSSTTATNPNAMTNKTGTTNVLITDGEVKYALGGGRLGYAYVGTANLTINGGTFDEIVAGGVNGYTGTAKLTIEAKDGKSITTGLIASGNRGQVADVTVDLKSLGTNGSATNVAIGALTWKTSTDGGPNAIFDNITFNIAENISGISNIYLGGSAWTGKDNKPTYNPWANSRNNSLSDTTITINAPGYIIKVADVDGSGNAAAREYTINAGKTWTLTSGTLNLLNGSSLTLLNGATFTNSGTIIVNDLIGLTNAAAIGGNIQLAADIAIEGMNGALELINETTLDLNGHTITIEKIGKAGGDIKNQETYSSASGLPANANRIVIADNATVTIKDSVGTGKIKYTENADVTGTHKVKSPIKVGSATSSTLILDNVIIESTEYGIGVFTHGNLIVNGGSITAHVSAISGNGLESDCKITLNGGTYISTTTAAIFFPSTANLTVNGGTFTGATGFDIRAGTVSITNAKIVINIPDNSTIGSTGTSGPSSWKMGVAVIDHSAYASGTAISVTISGTTVTGADYDLYIGNLNRNDNGTFKGIDGTFNQDHKITVKVNGNTIYDKAAGPDYNRFTSDISSGSSSGGVPITPPPVDPEPEPIVPDNGNVTVPPIDEKKADELIHEAVSSGSDSVSIIGTSDVKGEYTEVTVSKTDLETISKKIENNNNINSVSIETSEGDIILEKEVLNSILETTDADSVSFEIEDAKDKLTEEQKEAVGDRPVYDINITAGNENITSFNGKTITISLPYTLKAGEDPENIVVYYVKEDGSLEKVNCTYKDGKVIFETDHLSKYVIGYEESDTPVTPDTPDDKKDDNNTIYYAVAAIVVILIIIALAYYFMKKKQ